MVPPLVSLCANDPRFTTKHLQSLKYVGVGAAPLGDTVIKKFEAKTKNTQLIEGRNFYVKNIRSTNVFFSSC